MKKLLLLLITSIFLIGCSKDDNNSNYDDVELNRIKNFDEPFLDFGTEATTFVEQFGEPDEETTSSDYDYGFDLVYKIDKNGIYEIRYTFNAYETLVRTTVVIYAKNNLEYIKEYLKERYGTPNINESYRFGTTYRYYTDNVDVELHYFKDPYFAYIEFTE